MSSAEFVKSVVKVEGVGVRYFFTGGNRVKIVLPLF